MKADVLTMVVLIFCLGVLASSVGFRGVFKSDPTPPPTALQQGIATR